MGSQAVFAYVANSCTYVATLVLARLSGEAIRKIGMLKFREAELLGRPLSVAGAAAERGGQAGGGVARATTGARGAAAGRHGPYRLATSLASRGVHWKRSLKRVEK